MKTMEFTIQSHKYQKGVMTYMFNWSLKLPYFQEKKLARRRTNGCASSLPVACRASSLSSVMRVRRGRWRRTKLGCEQSVLSPSGKTLFPTRQMHNIFLPGLQNVLFVLPRECKAASGLRRFLWIMRYDLNVH